MMMENNNNHDDDDAEVTKTFNHHHLLFHPTELTCFQKLESTFSFLASNEDNNYINQQFLIYCAGGYRSRILMSIFEGALLALMTLNNSNSNTTSSTTSVADVGRGAVELMSQHADLWSVKDRGIVCVS